MTDTDPLATLKATLADYPRQLAEATAKAAALAAETVTGYSSDESVAVDALGTGRIVAVRILAPRRDLDSVTLGEAVTAAANAALGAVDALQDSVRRQFVTGHAGGDSRQRFTDTMNALLTRVDSLNSRLDSQLAALNRPPAPSPTD